jgi:hypothetical protein
MLRRILECERYVYICSSADIWRAARPPARRYASCSDPLFRGCLSRQPFLILGPSLWQVDADFANWAGLLLDKSFTFR